jgi:hypothetical protein
MNVKELLHRYGDRFKSKHGKSTSSDQWSAMNAMLGCREGQYGEVALSCNACDWSGSVFQSCGHRACNQCQNHSATQWLERQQNKLLPVTYFLVTFTLPHQLRSLVRNNQAECYSLMFKSAADTLKQFAANDRQLGCDIGMTGVLHTHSRPLNYHPHIHFIVPAGGLLKSRKEWRKKRGKYLFKEKNLAIVFRATLLQALKQSGLWLPRDIPKAWIVDCEHVGSGLPALKYLSRYLYRGVISNKNIIADDGDNVSFQYVDSATGKTKTRQLPGEDFIALLLQHTLPKGFRRARDFGFLHGNASKTLRLVQYILCVKLPEPMNKTKPSFLCKCCSQPLSIVGFIRRRVKPQLPG